MGGISKEKKLSFRKICEDGFQQYGYGVLVNCERLGFTKGQYVPFNQISNKVCTLTKHILRTYDPIKEFIVVSEYSKNELRWQRYQLLGSPEDPESIPYPTMRWHSILRGNVEVSIGIRHSKLPSS